MIFNFYYNVCLNLKRINYPSIEPPISYISDSEDNCDTCDEALVQLETIDDDAEAVGVRVIKTDDTEIAEEYGITEFPAVIYFENEDPSIYDGRKPYKFNINKQPL